MEEKLENKLNTDISRRSAIKLILGGSALIGASALGLGAATNWFSSSELSSSVRGHIDFFNFDSGSYSNDGQPYGYRTAILGAATHENIKSATLRLSSSSRTHSFTLDDIGHTEDLYSPYIKIPYDEYYAHSIFSPPQMDSPAPDFSTMYEAEIKLVTDAMISRINFTTLPAVYDSINEGEAIKGYSTLRGYIMQFGDAINATLRFWPCARNKSDYPNYYLKLIDYKVFDGSKEIPVELGRNHTYDDNETWIEIIAYDNQLEADKSYILTANYDIKRDDKKIKTGKISWPFIPSKVPKFL